MDLDSWADFLFLFFKCTTVKQGCTFSKTYDKTLLLNYLLTLRISKIMLFVICLCVTLLSAAVGGEIKLASDADKESRFAFAAGFVLLLFFTKHFRFRAWP